MRCEESFDREVIEPSSELGDVDSMAKYYVRESNECEVMDDYIAHEQTFKAGHASRQQEVDALNVKVKELQNTIRAEEIKINHEDGVYQEATHYTWLDDQNELLQAQISTLTKQLDEVTKVKERYEKALEFYASTDDKTDSFMRTNDDGITVWMCESDTEIVRDKSGAFLYYGKRAREALNGSSK